MKKLIDYQGVTPPPAHLMGKRRLWVFGAAVLFGAAMLLTGCAKDLAVDGPQGSEVTQTQTRATLPPPVEPREWAVEGAIYDEAMDVWMAPEPELLSKTAVKTQAGQATHYALKIYPKTEEEQWEIESDEEVQVSYVPFGYGQLTEQERAVVERTRAKTQSPDIEVSPYTVTYEDYESTAGPVESVTLQLPILYVVWPVSKPLPTTIEYTIEHEIFEQVSAQPLRAGATITLSGYLVTYDDTPGVQRNVPMANVSINYTLGDTNPNMWIGTTTDSNGRFSMQTDIPTTQADNLGYVYKVFYVGFGDTSGSERWRITNENSTASLSAVVSGNFPVGRNWVYYGDPTITAPTGNRQLPEIYRALRYFYDRPYNDFPKPNLPGWGIRIIAEDGPNAGSYNTLGMFTYKRSSITNLPTNEDPWITIYDIGETNSVMIGATLHELGHFIHFSEYADGYYWVPLLLTESFAEYVGWYIGKEYYTSIGWSTSSSLEDPTGRSRQTWTKNLQKGASGEYSPLFIDLTDTYNQKYNENNNSYDRPYPMDAIQYLPSYVPRFIIPLCSSWSACKQLIRQEIVPDYATSAQFDAYMADYDYWFSIPSNN